MSAQVVTYAVDDSTSVSFEIEPVPGFRPVGGAKEILGRVQQAVAPAVEAAKVVLDKVEEAGPDQVELKFGVKVSGGTNWLVAKTAGEGNFEITLTWERKSEASRRGSRSHTSHALSKNDDQSEADNGSLAPSGPGD
jgi:hypothetical protein